MATSYYKEGIERITEQALEQNVLNDIADIIGDVQTCHKKATTEILNIRNRTTDPLKTEGEIIGQGKEYKDDFFEYLAEQKRSLIQKFSDNPNGYIDDDGNNQIGFRGKLINIDNEANGIYQNITSLEQNTENKIKNDIIAMVAEKGYRIVASNDGNGNVTVTIVKG